MVKRLRGYTPERRFRPEACFPDTASEQSVPPSGCRRRKEKDGLFPEAFGRRKRKESAEKAGMEYLRADPGPARRFSDQYEGKGNLHPFHIEEQDRWIRWFCFSLPHMPAAQREVPFPADSQAPSRCGNNGSYRREHADPSRKPERCRLRSTEAVLLPSRGFLRHYPDKRGENC